jgi:hypothetical protein
MESNAFASDALSKRVAHLRKAYAKGLGHKPSTLEAAALLTAARLTAEAERALADPAVSLNEKVRIDGAARRARADMKATLQANKRDLPAPSLGAVLKGAAHG